MDRNGNFISMQYVSPASPALMSVTDTVGRTFAFHYDTSNRLIAITGPGVTGTSHEYVRLHYKNFSSFVTFGTHRPFERKQLNVNMIDAIYFSATQQGLWFGDSQSFNPFGMLQVVKWQKEMGITGESLASQGTVLQGDTVRTRSYAFPRVTVSEDVPVYKSMTESWVGGERRQRRLTR